MILRPIALLSILIFLFSITSASAVDLTKPWHNISQLNVNANLDMAGKNITNIGNVGIGTATPGTLLDIKSGSPMQLYLSTSRAFPNSRNWGIGTNQNTEGDLTFRQSTTNANTPSVDRLTIDVNGNVGIGTTGPISTLDVRSSSVWRPLTVGGNGGTDIVVIGNYGGIATIGAHNSTASAWTSLAINPGGGNVGIGITGTPSYNLQVAGSFAARYKNFEIPNPLDPQNKVLVHSSLEGPEHAVYYRGEAALKNGEARITLPNYFEALTRKEGRTVLLTNIDGFDGLAVKTQGGQQVKDGRFLVYSNNPGSAQKFNWEVKAVRSDIPPLVDEKKKV